MAWDRNFVFPSKITIFVELTTNFSLMGKGDVKTKRGKIVRGSYGKLRPRNKKAETSSAKTK